MTPEFRLFEGNARVEHLAPDDRGYAYGDGLFETMRAHRGTVPWWPRHWARLASGAARLGIPLPDPARVHGEALALLAGRGGVLRLQLTRGRGGRGYGPPVQPVPAWALSLHPLPPPPPDGGWVVRWSTVALAAQPVLAGLKHCNRLEQVMARAELEAGGDATEALMTGPAGEAVSATAANLFVLLDGAWHTPPVDTAGVAGVCRGWLLETGQATERRLSRMDVERAGAVVLTNAVRGILPVRRLGARQWAPHPRVARLQRALAAAHPSFADHPPEPT